MKRESESSDEEQQGARAKRPSMLKLVSRQNQSKNGIPLRGGPSKGAKATLRVILPVRVLEGVSKGKKWTRTTIVGILGHMDAGEKSETIAIPCKLGENSGMEERMEQIHKDN